MSASCFQISDGVSVDSKRLLLVRELLKGFRVVLMSPHNRAHFFNLAGYSYRWTSFGTPYRRRMSQLQWLRRARGKK